MGKALSVGRVLLFVLGFWLGLLVGACAAEQAPAVPQSIAVTHVTVIDGTGGKARPEQTVIVEGERIAAIGKSRKVKVPPGALVIDGTGKFLIPGLWDMHVHMTELPHFSELNIANGVTGVRDMFGQMTNIMAERREIANGKPGPHIVAAGRLIDGPKPIWPESIPAGNAEEGRRAVLLAKAEGSDFIKVYQLLPRDAYFAIAAESKRQGLVFAGHVPSAVSAAEASDAGQKSMEHLIGILPACSTRETELFQTNFQIGVVGELLDTYDERKAQALFARFKRNHTWQCPTLTVLQGFSRFDDGSFTNDFRSRYLDAETVEFWKQRISNSTNVSLAHRAIMGRAGLKQQELVRKMRRAGVEFLAGTDSPNPYCYPGFGLHEELARLVAAGLTPMEALQAATLNAARYLGKEKELGSVQPGKFADLVLLDADPLQDIHNTAKIRGVFANGRFYERKVLDGFLRAAEAKAGEPPMSGPAK